jgi:tetratricopeptide (TPR) repeat protein
LGQGLRPVRRNRSGRADLFTEQHQELDLGRAWRGMGYVLIEQGRLEEAEAIYKKCLTLDPNDEKAKGELRYIKERKSKNSPA